MTLKNFLCYIKLQEGQMWHQKTCFYWHVPKHWTFSFFLSFIWFSIFFILLTVLSLLLYYISTLLSSLLFSSSPDVDPDGSCCPVHFVSVQCQLVSKRACVQLLKCSCSSTAVQDFYGFSWMRRERDFIGFHSKIGWAHSDLIYFFPLTVSRLECLYSNHHLWGQLGQERGQYNSFS